MTNVRSYAPLVWSPHKNKHTRLLLASPTTTFNTYHRKPRGWFGVYPLLTTWACASASGNFSLPTPPRFRPLLSSCHSERPPPHSANETGAGLAASYLAYHLHSLLLARTAEPAAPLSLNRQVDMVIKFTNHQRILTFTILTLSGPGLVM